MNEDDEVAAWIQAELDKEESIRKECALRDAREEIKTKDADSMRTSTSLDGILAERGKTHGNYLIQSAVSQELKRLVRAGPEWVNMEDHQRDAIEMILMKISRIVTGDSSHKDSWVDISGYSTLISNTLDLNERGTINEVS